MGFLLWPLLVLSICVGVSMVIIVISACILIGENRITLPGSNARKIETAAAESQVAKLLFEKEQAETWRDDLIDARLNKVKGLPRGDNNDDV
jgi:hypothetical protein